MEGHFFMEIFRGDQTKIDGHSLISITFDFVTCLWSHDRQHISMECLLLGTTILFE